MATVSGRARLWARRVKAVCVSPRPWRRMRTFWGVPVRGGVMSRVIEGGKLDWIGIRGILELVVLRFEVCDDFEDVHIFGGAEVQP